MVSKATVVATKAIAHREDKRDDALEQSFPASDPPAASHVTGAEVHADAPKRSAEAMEHVHDQAESDLLDEALDESFPASDPPAMTLKRGKDDAEPG